MKWPQYDTGFKGLYRPGKGVVVARVAPPLWLSDIDNVMWLIWEIEELDRLCNELNRLGKGKRA